MSVRDEGTVTLAPMAGAGIGKQLADALLAEPGFMKLMRDTAIGCLNAMGSSRWDKAANDGKGGWVRDEDFRVRAQMFFGLLAHMEGEPVKRIIHQHLGAAGGIDLKATLRESPELAALLAGELEKANWRKSGRNGKQPKPAEAIEP